MKHRILSALLLSGIFLADSAAAAPQTPEGLSESDWLQIQEAHQASRYAVKPAEQGFSAANPGQGWSTQFMGGGFTTRPVSGGWTWGLELQRYGFAAFEKIVNQPTRESGTDQRVVYEWDTTLEEWYINDARGLEHGYTVHSRPHHGEGSAPPGPLTFTIAVRGELSPEVLRDGRGVRFLGEGGATVLTYAGLTVFDADGKKLAAQFEAVPDGLLLTIDESAARYPITIDPVAQQAYLKASNTQFSAFFSDAFGKSVAVFNNTVVVGAPREESNATGVNGNQANNSLQQAGAVYVFERTGSSWTQQAYIKASNTNQADLFGTSVALSRNTLVVGAWGEDSPSQGINVDQSQNSSNQSGAVYVFVRNGINWSQEAYIKASNSFSAIRFGETVAISEHTIVVGATNEDGSSTGVNGNQFLLSSSNSGAAYVFVRSGSEWTQEAYLKASNTGPGDHFGSSVTIAGNTIVVGARFEGSSATGVNGDQTLDDFDFAGAAYVFVRNGTTWSQEAYLKASNTDDQDYFGTCVALSEDTIVVGSPREQSNASGINGNQNDNSLFGAGAAYVFVRDGTTWSQQAYVKPSNTGSNDGFASCVAIADDLILIGAPSEASNSVGIDGEQTNNLATSAGAAYLFERTGSAWAQRSYIKASNTGSSDQFGNAVALSAELVCVGAREESSIATGVNGDSGDNSAPGAGAVYTYDIPHALDSAATSLSLAAGGQQALALDAGTTRANWFYWVFGSATGTSPGLNFGGGLILPLNFDGYFNLTLTKPGLGAFGNFIGHFDGSGIATATLTFPMGIDPSLAGVTLNHAYLAAPSLGHANYASNPVPLLLTL